MIHSFISACVYAAKKLHNFCQNSFQRTEPDVPQLHRFSAWGNKPTVAHLISEGVDINKTHCYQDDNDYVTAMAVATNPQIIEMLMDAGGIDSHDLKLIGHSLGLQGSIFLKGKENSYGINYEGMSEERAFPIVAHHIGLFEKKILEESTGTAFNGAEKKALNIISQAFDQFVRHRDDKFFNPSLSYHQGKALIIRCVWPGHTGFTLLYKDKLYIANKGGNTLIPSISCYQIDAGYLKSLSVVDFSSLIESIGKKRKNIFSSNLSLKGFKKLNPRLLYYKRLSRQKNKNCSYSNVKRGFEVILTALLDDSALTWENKIDKEKMYEAFTMFDRLSSIDEYTEKYKLSPNPQVWEPLLTYLRDKSGLSERTKFIAAYIIHKLKGSAINLSDDEIIHRMNKIQSCRNYMWKFYTLAGRFEDLLFENKNRIENIKKIVCHVPFIWRRQRAKALSVGFLEKVNVKPPRYN